jgi:putative ABC transport system permease protein
VLVGLDSDRGLGGSKPLLALDWVSGPPQTVIPKLKAGRGVIVPDHFLRETGLKVGDAFKVNPPADSTRVIEYTIAGVVRLKGWHWITNLSGLRVNSGRSSALCFADHDTVAKDFDLKTIKFFWSDAAGPIDSAKLSADAQAYASTQLNQVYEAAGGGLPQGDGGYTVRVTTPQDVTARIRGRAGGWIWSLSQLPLVTLAVASIGVLNAILASVRGRRWDVGVLRALGFTRGTLVRLVVAEALLVGVVACLLSLGFGVLAGWCGSGISSTSASSAGCRRRW